MTETTGVGTGGRWRAAAPVRAAGRARPVWDTAFADPVREGHLRLAGLTRTERQLARAGLVGLALLLVSLLFTDVWRRGTLLPLDAPGRLTFLPVGLLPVTLVAFLLAWSLLAWGALAASPVVRVVVAATFLLTNASLSVPASIEVNGRAALEYGPDLVRAGYLGTAAALVVSALLAPLARTSRVLRPVLRTAAVGGLALFFLTHLWIHVVFVDEGLAGGVQTLMSGAITEIDGLLLPLVYVSGVLVVDFSLDVATGVSESARELPLRVARWLLAALLAVKLWVEVGNRWADWTTYVEDRPAAVARTVVAVLVLGAVVALVTRFPLTDAFERAKELLLYGSAALYASAILLAVLVVGVGVFSIAQLEVDHVPWFVTRFPTVGLTRYGPLALAGLALLVGLRLLRRRRSDLDREVGSGLVVLGCWTVPALALSASGSDLGFSDPLVDVLVTVGVAVLLAVRWRRLDAGTVVALGALTVFSWLAMSRGDWISVIGALIGLPAIVVVVVGIAFSVAGDAGFTATSTRRLPQGARVLLFVGYLVLSVTILHWVEATHADSHAAGAADAGFFYLGIPWAAWLVGRRLLQRPGS
ncbi:hypothetical protein [Nocardioides aquiterrae]|uniref:Uncharacterized protein n=1 Tax=Nocardioides aquiterrae TaxID=203799 RepID=A0ABN1US80_9ACTN